MPVCWERAHPGRVLHCGARGEAGCGTPPLLRGPAHLSFPAAFPALLLRLLRLRLRLRLSPPRFFHLSPSSTAGREQSSEFGNNGLHLNSSAALRFERLAIRDISGLGILAGCVDALCFPSRC